jgi:hypothetical protein
MHNADKNRLNDEKKYVVIVERLAARGVTEKDIADTLDKIKASYDNSSNS